MSRYNICNKTVCDHLQTDVDVLSDWRNRYNLSFNSSKCVLYYVHVHLRIVNNSNIK